MRKKISAILAVIMCATVISIPVSAGTSYLDIKAGDTSSYYTIKDSGSAWDNFFYVTPHTKIGTIRMASSAQDNTKTSPFYNAVSYATRFSYGSPSAPGGKYYRIISYGTTTGWHLTGNYTP